MKIRLTVLTLCLVLCATLAHAQSLDAALSAMDKAAADFHSAQCDFTWDQYTVVADDHDYQKGTMYFHRQGNDVEMAADITAANNYKKYLVYKDAQVSIYEPSIEQVTEYNAGKNKAAFESFLVLGFGGRGHDLTNSFDVKYDGMEQAQGVNADKLELTPKSQRVQNMFKTIYLWIDPARGVSVQQKFIDPDGNYRLAQYTNIKINQKLPPDAFKLKTTGKTKVIKPNS